MLRSALKIARLLPTPAATALRGSAALKKSEGRCYLPHMQEQVSRDLEAIRTICHRLLGPGGCPWDQKQTLETLTPYLLEETHEVLEAISQRDYEKAREELGDLLFLVVFMVTVGERDGRFTMEQVAGGIIEKIVRRHPHVFGSKGAASTEAVERQWEAIKAREKRARGTRQDPLESGAATLPALLAAFRAQEKAASYGFDWPDQRGVLEKVEEEIGELRSALETEGPDRRREEELGDLLFSMVNLARWLRIDPERALRGTTSRFQRRFARMAELLERKGVALERASLEEMEAAWQEAKHEEAKKTSKSE